MPHILFYFWKSPITDRSIRSQCLQILVQCLQVECCGNHSQGQSKYYDDKTAFIREMYRREHWLEDVSKAILYDLGDESIPPQVTCVLCDFMESVWENRSHIDTHDIVKKYLDALALSLQHGMCSRNAKLHTIQPCWSNMSVTQCTRVIRYVSLWRTSHYSLITFVSNPHQAK